MRTIVHIRDRLWSNLASIAFCLGLAASAVWLDHRFRGEVSIFIWIFAGLLVLFCWIPIDAIRRPRSRLLAFDGSWLLWRICDGKTREILLEKRLPLVSIRTLKWVVPRPEDCRHGQDHSNAQLFFVTAEGGTHRLPDEFFPAPHRRKIEAALKQEIPSLTIVEKLESTK